MIIKEILHQFNLTNKYDFVEKGRKNKSKLKQLYFVLFYY